MSLPFRESRGTGHCTHSSGEVGTAVCAMVPTPACISPAFATEGLSVLRAPCLGQNCSAQTSSQTACTWLTTDSICFFAASLKWEMGKYCLRLNHTCQAAAVVFTLFPRGELYRNRIPDIFWQCTSAYYPPGFNFPHLFFQTDHRTLHLIVAINSEFKLSYD